MKLLKPTPHLFTIDKAEQTAACLNRGEDDWRYEIVPIDKTTARIDVYDEENVLMGPL